LRALIFETMLRLPLSFVRDRSSGELMNRADSDVDALVTTVVGSVEPTLASLLGTVLTLIVMFRADWRLTLIAAATIPLWALASRPAAKRLAGLRLEMMRARDRVVSNNVQALSYGGALTIKNTGAYAREVDRFRRIFSDVVTLRLSAARIGKFIQFLLTALAGLGPALVLTAGAYLVSHHETTVGTLVAFLNLQGRLYGPASQLANLNLQISTARAVLKRVIEVLAIVPERRSGLRYTFDAVVMRDATLAIGDHELLASTTLTVALGERIALIGESGSGKSTLAALLAGYFEPTSGEITIGGVPLHLADLDALRRDIMLVPQQPVLFARTIRDNVTMGGDCDDAQIFRVLDALGARYIVDRYPQGLDTVLDPSLKLSGGEQQRLALARALLSPARMLILDEATSALDASSEQAILATLESTAADRAVVFITHHPDRLPQVDRVVRINGARRPTLEPA
jgi:ABC-type bacteriocin/lantibiotic exporter with double-glycine peptidase domain